MDFLEAQKSGGSETTSTLNAGSAAKNVGLFPLLVILLLQFLFLLLWKLREVDRAPSVFLIGVTYKHTLPL